MISNAFVMMSASTLSVVSSSCLAKALDLWMAQSLLIKKSDWVGEVVARRAGEERSGASNPPMRASRVLRRFFMNAPSSGGTVGGRAVALVRQFARDGEHGISNLFGIKSAGRKAPEQAIQRISDGFVGVGSRLAVWR